MKEKHTELTPPQHPWKDRLEGLTRGKGDFYYWGPNYTVDPIVITNEEVPKILLIKRIDNGKWAIPGGFINEGEDPIVAGRRELKEETGYVLGPFEPKLVYAGPVDDHRATLDAWPETIALLWTVESTGKVKADDDAEDVAWVPLDKLPKDLHGSHLKLITMAVQGL